MYLEMNPDTSGGSSTIHLPIFTVYPYWKWGVKKWHIMLIQSEIELEHHFTFCSIIKIKVKESFPNCVTWESSKCFISFFRFSGSRETSKM